MNPTKSPQFEIEALVDLFYPDSHDELGQFDRTTSDELPQPAASLLDHSKHMTVTLESFHDSEVDVEVIQSRSLDQHYCRKILLTRKSDGAVVQFGIVRLDMSTLPEVVQNKIREQKTPLGRILIHHDVMRSVHLDKLYRVGAGSELATHFGISTGTDVFGRTAWIYCNGKPAIELLEIVNFP